MAKNKVELEEYRRLSEIYKNLPGNRRAVAEGLIIQAARLRARLDFLWKDIQENGETELFQQGDAPAYKRERPESRIFTATDKSYQTIIKQLADLVPVEESSDDDGFNCE